MKIKRTGSAAWQGGIKDGKGAISTQSGALKAYPYGFASRFGAHRRLAKRDGASTNFRLFDVAGVGLRPVSRT